MSRRMIYSFSLSEEVMLRLADFCAAETTPHLLASAVQQTETTQTLDSWGLTETDYTYLENLTGTQRPKLRSTSNKADWMVKLSNPAALRKEDTEYWVQSLHQRPGVAAYIKESARLNRAKNKKLIKQAAQQVHAEVTRSRAVEYLVNLALETLRGQETGTPVNAGQAGNKPANRRARRKVAA